MSWQDREYAQADYGSGPRRVAFGGFMRPRIMPMVKILLIANAAVFLAVNVFGITQLYQWGVFSLELAVRRAQIWRFMTYQYLHNGLGHAFWNMLWLYFLGNILEQRWGQRRFLLLYTSFGIVGAVLYCVLSAVGIGEAWPMIGASGAVLGLVGACAVAAPDVRVLLYFILPIRIRTLAIFAAVISVIMIMNADEASRTADACHLGGLAAGAAWAWMEAKGIIRLANRTAWGVGPSGRKWVKVKVRKGAWERKMKRQQAQQAQVDRILQKIHERGLNSLSRREKRLLQQASKNKS